MRQTENVVQVRNRTNTHDCGPNDGTVEEAQKAGQNVQYVQLCVRNWCKPVTATDPNVLLIDCQQDKQRAPSEKTIAHGHPEYCFLNEPVHNRNPDTGDNNCGQVYQYDPISYTPPLP